MSHLERKVRGVQRRLTLFRIFDAGLIGLLVGLSVSALFLLVSKLMPLGLPIYEIAASLAGVAVATSVVYTLTRRITLFEAALQADARLQLRERLSSALLLQQVAHHERPAYQALEQDADLYARQLDPRRDFRYQPPRYARHTVWPALACVAVSFLPQMNLLPGIDPPAAITSPSANGPETPEEKIQRERAAEEVRELAEQRREDISEIEEALNIELADRLERLERDLSLGRKSSREAVAEMSRMREELRIKERDLQRAAQPFRQLQGLQRAEQTRELKSDLKDQNFDRAAQRLEDLAQQLQSGQPMDSGQMEQLAQELQQLSESVSENEAMSQALEQAAEALQQASQEPDGQQDNQQSEQADSQQQQGANNQGAQGEQQGEEQQNTNGTQQSGAQQSQQAEANSGGGQQSQQANQQGDQSGQSGNQQQGQQASQQAMQSAAASLQQAASQMSEMQQMMEAAATVAELQQSLSQCMGNCMGGDSGQMASAGGQQGQSGGQPCSQGSSSGEAPAGGQMPGSMGGNRPSDVGGMGNFAEGQPSRQGAGSGGPGIGNGQVPFGNTMDMQFEDVFIPGQKNEGQIIGVFEIDATAPRGESKVGYTRVPQSYRQQAAEAINDTETPVGMRNAVRDYFEAINFGVEGAATGN